MNECWYDYVWMNLGVCFCYVVFCYERDDVVDLVIFFVVDGFWCDGVIGDFLVVIEVFFVEGEVNMLSVGGFIEVKEMEFFEFFWDWVCRLFDFWYVCFFLLYFMV